MPEPIGAAVVSKDIRAMLNRVVKSDIRANRMMISDEILQQIQVLETRERDLTRLVMRLCREIRRTNPDSQLAFDSVSFLIREGLTSTMRGEG